MNDGVQTNSISGLMRAQALRRTDFEPLTIAVVRWLDDLAGLTEILIGEVRQQNAALTRIAAAAEDAVAILRTAKAEADDAHGR
jgi:hypothetical protein